MPTYDFIDRELSRKARSVRAIHPDVRAIAINPTGVTALRYIKLVERLAASSC